MTARFHRKVVIYSPGGRHVRTVHAELAERMIREGTARRRCRGNRPIRALELIAAAGLTGQGRPTAATPQRLLGQKYTYWEALKQDAACPACLGVVAEECWLCGGEGIVRETFGHVLSLRRIARSTRWAFLLSLLDCLPPPRLAAAMAMLRARGEA